MLKKLYVSAWFLLILAAAATIFTGSLNEVGMVAFGLIGLALVYAMALWVVFVNPGQMQQQAADVADTRPK